VLHKIQPKGDRRRGYLLTCFAAISFGLYPATSRLAYAEGANQTFLIILTTFFRAAFLFSAALRKRYPVSAIFSDIGSSFFSGFLQAVSIIGIFGSLQYIPGPVMITIIFTHTLMLLLLMHWTGEAPLTKLATISAVIALLGITMVVDVYSDLSNLNFFGLSLAFVAAVATASRAYTFGKLVKIIPHEIVGTRVFSCAALFVLFIVFIQLPHFPTSTKGFFCAALSCFSLGFGTAATFSALSLLGSFRVSLTLKLEPLCTCFYSWVILNELLSPIQYVGIALVLASLLIYQLLDTEKKENAEVETE